LEHNFYCGNYYGTLRSEVDSRLAAGKVVVLVIDVHGAANIKRMYPAATTVFICPPSACELEKRLRGRGTESDESLEKRLAEAKAELAQASTYDLRLTNVDVSACAEELYALISARIGR
jgi:guanylate kinase